MNKNMEVTVEESLEMKTKNDVVFLDVREGWERDICAINGDVHIPMGQLMSKHNELPKEKTIIIYCHTGNRSLHAAQFLKQHGFNAVSMKGGIEEWALRVDERFERY